MSESRPIRCEVHYFGHVQAVGFRWNACHIARDFPVTGFVRNLPDGRVHLVAEGERGEVERLLAAIADSMGGSIRHTETVVSPATGEYQGFEITK